MAAIERRFRVFENGILMTNFDFYQNQNKTEFETKTRWIIQIFMENLAFSFLDISNFSMQKIEKKEGKYLFCLNRFSLTQFSPLLSIRKKAQNERENVLNTLTMMLKHWNVTRLVKETSLDIEMEFSFVIFHTWKNLEQWTCSNICFHLLLSVLKTLRCLRGILMVF